MEENCLIVIGVDVETTGLDTPKDSIIEIGAVLYDTASRVPLDIFNALVRPRDLVPEGYVSPTGIKGEWLLRHGISFPEAMGRVQLMIATGEPVAMVCHNGINFDRPIILAELKRHQIMEHAIESLHLVDTRQDLPFEKEPANRSLLYLSADAGFLNPFPHRALFDVCTMLKVLDRFPFSEVLAQSKVPYIRIRALVTFDTRQMAKDLRYSWESVGDERVPGAWWKKIRENAFAREEQAAAEKGFKIVRF
jgi:DNA polymerase-3 subunit epsilon